MRICAGAALIEKENVLLGLRSGESRLYPNTWDIFGGHCEEGETIEETLARELEEELGVHPIRYEALGIFEEPNPQDYGEAQYHVFAVFEWTGEPTSLGDEHQSIRWFHVNELRDIDMASTKYHDLFSRFGRGT